MSDSNFDRSTSSFFYYFSMRVMRGRRVSQRRAASDSTVCCETKKLHPQQTKTHNINELPPTTAFLLPSLMNLSAVFSLLLFTTFVDGSRRRLSQQRGNRAGGTYKTTHKEEAERICSLLRREQTRQESQHQY